MEIIRRDFVRLSLLLTASGVLPKWARAEDRLAVSGRTLSQTGSPAHDMETIRDRFLRAMTPPNLSKLAATAEHFAQTLQSDSRWPNVDYADQSRSQWKTSQHLLNVLDMAVAYGAAELQSVQRQRLHEKIILALQWWLTNDPKNPNWWHNEIGVPKFLGTIGLFMGDGIDDATRARLIELMKRSNWAKWTGQNLVWGTQIQILRGILAQEPQTVAQAFARMYGEVSIGAPTGEGIMPDYSFHQHGSQLYSGGYGLNFANDIGGFVGFAWGTAHQISPDKMKIYTDFMLDGEAWMTIANVFDYAACGREITRKGKLASPPDVDRATVANPAGAFHLADTCAHLGAMDVPRRDEFASFSARLRSQAEAKKLSGNRHFWCSDYMTHRRPGFFASVRMFSTRTLNTELVNSEGKQSHQLADGCTFLYRNGDEYRDIFPVWIWSQVPGTTAEQIDLLREADNPRYKTDAEFVGGVSDGSYGVAAQDVHRDTLRAKKMWMMFDEGFAALGTDINCDSDRDVVTTLNQCLVRGELQQDQNSVTHDEIRYEFPGNQTIRIFSGEQTGRWSNIGVGSDQDVTLPVFRTWIEHGVRPKNATYTYFVLSPAASKPAKVPSVRVIANTAELQAAHVPSAKLTGAAFWRAGRLEDGAGLVVTADQPCLLMVRELDGMIRVSASNPLNRATNLTVTINRSLQGENATAAKGGTLIRFDLPGGAMAGSTIVRDLKI